MRRTTLSLVLVTLLCTFATAAGCKASGQIGTDEPKTPPPPQPSATVAPVPTPTTSASAEPPKPEKKELKGDVKGSRVMIPGNIVYETGKAKIKPESEPTLNQLKQFLDDNPQVTLLRIEGHTDSDGDDNANMKLSGERALSVVKWLTDHGVARERLVAVGFGEEKPLVPNTTKENKEQNRRTEFHIAQLDGKNFLGRDPTGGGNVFK